MSVKNSKAGYKVCSHCNKNFRLDKFNKNDIFCSGKCKLNHDDIKENRYKVSEQYKILNDCFQLIKTEIKEIEGNNILVFKNEHEFLEWFKVYYFLFGIKRLIKIDDFFPDVIAELHNGKVVNIELEYYSSNFKKHGHTPYYCDLIISYLKPPYQDKVNGVPVLSLYIAKDFVANLDFDYKTLEYTEFFGSIVNNSINQIYKFLENNKNIWR